MSRHVLILALSFSTALAGQPSQQVRSEPPSRSAQDSLSALRTRYLAEINDLLPQLRAAERATAIADSIKGSDLPGDTVVVGTMTWLIDRSRTPRVYDGLTQAWEQVHRVFGSETRVLNGVIHAARVRTGIRGAPSRKVIDLAEVVPPGQLNIFDRVPDNESAEVIGERISSRAARTILNAGDPWVALWLIRSFDPVPLKSGKRELMYADLVTAPSQVASRCLAGDLARCRDALGLVNVADPLTEWYDAPERRLLVRRMSDHLAQGPRRAEYVECVDRHSYSTCDRILRSVPGYTPPPALPASARQHLFRMALTAGGADAYSRLSAGTNVSVQQRLANAAGMPIDSLVARWRADLIAARPPSPVPSMASVWTAVAWGVAIMLLALKVVSWR